MKKTNLLVFFFLTLLFVVWGGVSGAATLTIETRPIFADVGAGTNIVYGSYNAVYSESFTFGTPVNTGPLSDYDATPPLNFGLNYWIKSQAGAFDPSTNQMVIQIEGADNGFNGGMFDIMNNVDKYDTSQPIPAGKEFWGDYFRIGVYDILFPSEPTVLTNSRIQNYVTFGGYLDPGTMTLDPNSANWQNIFEDPTFGGGLPVIQSTWDASGLDIFYEFSGSLYWADALEDQALRMVTFFEGDLPGGNGPDPDPDPLVPEPTTLLLFGFGLLGLAGMNRKK